jgi:hypothetical protein
MMIGVIATATNLSIVEKLFLSMTPALNGLKANGNELFNSIVLRAEIGLPVTTWRKRTLR